MLDSNVAAPYPLVVSPGDPGHLISRNQKGRRFSGGRNLSQEAGSAVVPGYRGGGPGQTGMVDE